MKKQTNRLLSLLLAFVMLLSMLPTTAFATDIDHTQHQSYITHVAAAQGNCTTPGNIEFWYCDYYTCEKCYSDAAMTQEISPADVVITPGAHSEACGYCGHNTTVKTFDQFVPANQPDYDEEYYFWSNGGFHGAFSDRLDGSKVLFVGEGNDGKLYAMSNVTNEDGSRQAVDLSLYLNTDGSVTVNSDIVEFFTYRQYTNIDTTYTFSPDNGYMAVMDGEIVVRGQNIENFRAMDITNPNDDLHETFPQAIRFEQDYELSDFNASNGKGYLFSWSLNSGLILFDSTALKFVPTLMWTEENGTTVDNRAHNIMLYVERCEHPNMTYTAPSTLTCTQDGAIEHWHCNDCGLYFADAQGNTYIELPEGVSDYEDYLYTPSWGHTYDDCICENCGLPCPHTNAVYYEYESIPSSCFEPGLRGCWFCEECYRYLDQNQEHPSWDEMLASRVPATGHAFNTVTGQCNYCGLPNPVYTKVTSLADVNEEDLYIFVAEVGGRYFVLGGLDESTPDEQGNVWCGNSGNAIEVTPYDDGSISLLNQSSFADFSSSEFMLDVNPEQFGSGLSEFGLTTVMPKLPNDCIYPFQSTSLDNTGFMGVPRYANGVYGQWDSSDWIIDFYTTTVDDNTYNDGVFSGEVGKTHAQQLTDGNIGENIEEGDLLLYNSSFVSVGGAMFTLRFRVYPNPNTGATEYYFICGEDWALEGSPGWDYVTGTTLTNDTQYAISLYRYDVPTVDTHTCIFSDWVNDGSGKTHTRVCMDPACGKIETELHRWNDGVATLAPTCTEAGVMTYTCTVATCGAVKTESVGALNHDWSNWTYASVDSHIRSCNRNCGIAQEIGGHKWSDWTPVDGATHKTVCDICKGEQTGEHDWDNGVVTKEPTESEAGIKTYTCGTCAYTRTETIPMLEHTHSWSDWGQNDESTHIRSCRCNATETAVHQFNDGEVTQAPTHEAVGEIQYTCADCGYSYTEEIPALTEHEWSDWVINKLDEANTHIRYCICNESQTAPHNFDNGQVTTEATHTSNGVMTFTCTDDCGYSYTEEIPALTEHEWTNWSPNDNETHTRSCRCNANETNPCEWDNGVVTAPTCGEEGTTVYTCTVCGNTKTETTPALNHDWSDWTDTGANAPADIHERSCRRDDCDAKEIGNHEWSNWTSIGSTEHKKTCSVCNGERTAAHAWDSGVVTKAATVKETGTRKYTCADCGATKTEIISKIVCDHSWSKWMADNDETHTHTCVNGNGCTAYQQQAHTWDNGVVTTEPTETTEGVMTYTCLVCSHEKTEKIAMLAHTHSFGDWTGDGADMHTRKCVNGSTCTATETEVHSCNAWANNEDGTHSGKCAVCGEGIIEAHTWSEWVVQNDGSLKRTCTAECGAYEELPVLQPITESVVITTSNKNDASAELEDDAVVLFNNVLTDDEQKAVAEGNTTVSVYLEVTDIPVNNVSASDKAAAAAVIEEADNDLDENTEIGMYLDIDLFKEVTTTTEETSGSTTTTTTATEASQVTETSDKVTITIEIPDDLINNDASVERIYRIIRVHEDENGNVITDVIEGVFDPVNKTFTFETDKFSTYALAYNDTEKTVKTYTVTYTDGVDGVVVFADQIFTVEAGKATPTISNPTRIGYTFKGWNPSVQATVTGNATYTAIWQKNDESPVITPVVPPVPAVPTVPSVPTEPIVPSVRPSFTDVAADAYYADAVKWAVTNGITNGTSVITFSPDAACTRAQMVTFLWRAAGSPNPMTTVCPFADVDMNSYYSKAVLWAVENGITNGTGNGTFSPDAECTRAQMAAFLCRMAGGKSSSNANIFTDVKADAYYAEAVRWAVENGITNGTGAGKFSPDAICTRAQMVTFLYRYFA